MDYLFVNSLGHGNPPYPLVFSPLYLLVLPYRVSISRKRKNKVEP